MNREREEETKKYKAAAFHEKVINARGRNMPAKLAELGALCVAIGAGIWTKQYDGLVIGSAIVMFILYSFILQIVSHLVFWFLSVITFRTYNRTTYDEWESTQYGDWEEQEEQEEQDFSEYGSQSYGYYEYQNERSNKSQSSMSVDSAKLLFGLNGTFSKEDLKKAWREEIKKCHPDQNVDGAHAEEYEERTKKINLAYDLLKDLAS